MAKSRKGGLGKGLDLLIPQGVMNELMESGANLDGKKVTSLKISKVEPNREQPRKRFDENALNELAESIKQYGILQPLVVCQKDGYYEIVSGERRWRAAQIAGLKEVPAVIMELTEQEIMEISLIENIQREDLNPVEEAMAYQRLIQEFGLTQEVLAQKVSKSRTVITNTIRLLKLNPQVQKMLTEEEINTGHARALLGIEDLDKQYEVAQKIVSEGLTVREIESLVKELKEEKTQQKSEEFREENKTLTYRGIEEKLKTIIGTKVQIKNKKNNKGKIEIEYYSVDDLERIVDLFNQISEL